MNQPLNETTERIADRTLAWQQGCWYWGDAIAIDGLMSVYGGEASWVQVVASRAASWHDVAPPSWDDALAPGRALVSLARVGAVKPDVVRRAVAAMQRLPVNQHGAPLLRPHVPEWRDLVWIDSLYHLPPSLAAAGMWLEDDVLVSTATTIAQTTLQLLETPGGLAHFYDGGLRKNNGVVWSRGMGWALLGLLDLLDIISDSSTTDIAQAASAILNRFVETQEPNGQWRTILGDERAGTETSAAAFFVAGALHPRARTLYQASESVVESAETAVLGCVEEDGTYTGVSHDTHARWDIQSYYHPPTRPSPWGQGSALRAVIAMDRAGRQPAAEKGG